ncbi:MAG: LysE family transporter [Terracoccus sp.]
MSWSLWLTLVVTGVLISLTPGAGAVNTMTNSITAGWRRSIWGIAGQQAALVLHLAVVAAGLGVLVARSPIAFSLIRYAGAAYLVYLGIRQLRARPATAEPAAHPSDPSGRPEVPGRPEPAWSMARRGLLVNLTNPKAVVFFLAFTPQFIRPDRPLLPQYLVFGATIMVIDVIVMWFVFAAAAGGLARLTRSPSGQRAMGRVFGCLFIGVGILLAVAH